MGLIVSPRWFLLCFQKVSAWEGRHCLPPELLWRTLNKLSSPPQGIRTSQPYTGPPPTSSSQCVEGGWIQSHSRTFSWTDGQLLTLTPASLAVEAVVVKGGGRLALVHDLSRHAHDFMSSGRPLE